MDNTDFANCSTLPDKMEINVHTIGVLMLNRVGGHVDYTDVVTMHQSSPHVTSVFSKKTKCRPICIPG
jgi:hypothetical protein